MSVYEQGRRYAIAVMVIFFLSPFWLGSAQSALGGPGTFAVVLFWGLLGVPAILFIKCPRCATSAFRWRGRPFWVLWTSWPRKHCSNCGLDLREAPATSPTAH